MDFSDFTDYGFELDARRLFKRCKICGPTVPDCPKCPPGEYCTQISQSCNQCPSRKCMKIDESAQASPLPSPNQSSGGGGPNVGAIVGGIVGGIAFIAIATFLIWRFCIKDRREEWVEEDEDRFEENFEGWSGPPSASLAHRQSTHTMRSVASTTMTRASNVIQIAFIPGVTDRSGQNGEYEVPPVPPVPIGISQGSSVPHSPYTDSPDHYFMPSDLRDSAYSGFSEDSRSSYNRRSAAPSITPSLLRQSVVSAVYRNSEAETQPAQTAQRGRANMVSVSRSASVAPSVSSVPAVPTIDYDKYGAAPSRQADQSPARSAVGSGTGSGSQTPLMVNQAAVQRNSGVSPRAGPPGPPPAQPPAPPQEAEITAAIWQAAKEASKQPTHGGLGSVAAEPSPFSDANQAPTP